SALLFSPGGAALPRRPALRRRGGLAGGPSPPAAASRNRLGGRRCRAPPASDVSGLPDQPPTTLTATRRCLPAVPTSETKTEDRSRKGGSRSRSDGNSSRFRRDSDRKHRRWASLPARAIPRVMANVDELQKEHEARLSVMIAERAGKGGDSDLALVRALIHRAIHFAAERKVVELCGLTTF